MSYRAFTREQLFGGSVAQEPRGRRVSWPASTPSARATSRSLLEPYWIGQEKDASHGTPYAYDTHIPLVFREAGVHPGRYDAAVAR
jgi:hypothetical protein